MRFLLLAAVLLPATALAQDSTAPSCLEDLYDAFGREHRLARAVLFGRPSPEDAPLLSTFHNTDGDAWVKTDENEWKSPADGFENTTWTDRQMELQGERDVLCDENEDELEASCVQLPRTGIFETKKTPTTDLVGPIVQTIRALQCRLRAVCEVAAESRGTEEGERVRVTLDGCLPMTYPVLDGCRAADQSIFETLPGNCLAARTQLVEREMHLLTLTAAYDGSYRSLTQFWGMFQEFLRQFRFPLLEPLWQTVRVLGGLKGIPCFQGECNE